MAWAYTEIFINRAESTKEKDIEDMSELFPKFRPGCLLTVWAYEKGQVL